jgi:hypothetical protein
MNYNPTYLYRQAEDVGNIKMKQHCIFNVFKFNEFCFTQHCICLYRNSHASNRETFDSSKLSVTIKFYVTFEVLKAVLLIIQVFWQIKLHRRTLKTPETYKLMPQHIVRKDLNFQ